MGKIRDFLDALRTEATGRPNTYNQVQVKPLDEVKIANLTNSLLIIESGLGITSHWEGVDCKDIRNEKLCLPSDSQPGRTFNPETDLMAYKSQEQTIPGVLKRLITLHGDTELALSIHITLYKLLVAIAEAENQDPDYDRSMNDFRSATKVLIKGSLKAVGKPTEEQLTILKEAMQTAISLGIKDPTAAGYVENLLNSGTPLLPE